MNLLDFVDYLLDPVKLASFYRQQGFEPQAVQERLTIYMVGSTITLAADIRLLTFEETEGRIEIQLNGIDYVYVLEVDSAIDLLRASEPGVMTKLDQANLIVEYAIYDA